MTVPFIVLIDQAPVFWVASSFSLADTGENGAENLFAEDDFGSDGWNRNNDLWVMN